MLLFSWTILEITGYRFNIIAEQVGNRKFDEFALWVTRIETCQGIGFQIISPNQKLTSAKLRGSWHFFLVALFRIGFLSVAYLAVAILVRL